MKSCSLSFALAAMFTLNCGFASAEETAPDPQVKSERTNPKEETADKKPADKDAAKPTEDPNCE